MGSKWANLFARLGRTYVQLADSPDKDGAGRLRTSNPKTLFSAKFEYSKDSHFFDETNFGTGGFSTFLPSESSVKMEVPNPGDKLARQTSVWQQYQPLNSQEIANTAAFGPHEENILKEFGYYSGVDGPLLRQENGEFWVVLKSSIPANPPEITPPSEIAVPQSAWNIDKCNGGNKKDNPSGKNIDLTKTIIEHIDIVWLGVDRCRIDLKYDGIVIQIHEFMNAGRYDTVFMKTASLPSRFYIENKGNVSGGSMKQICTAIRSEGGEEVFGIQQAAKVYNLPVKAATFLAADAAGIVKPNYASFTPLLIVQPRATFHGLPNHGQIRVVEFEITVKGNVPVHWALLHNPTFVSDPLYSPIKLEGAGAVQPSLAEYATGTAAINTITNEGHPHNLGDASSAVKGTVSTGGEITSSIILVRGTFDTVDDSVSDKYCIAVAGDGADIPEVSLTIRLAEIF